MFDFSFWSLRMIVQVAMVCVSLPPIFPSPHRKSGLVKDRLARHSEYPKSRPYRGFCLPSYFVVLVTRVVLRHPFGLCHLMLKAMYRSTGAFLRFTKMKSSTVGSDNEVYIALSCTHCAYTCADMNILCNMHLCSPWWQVAAFLKVCHHVLLYS